MPRAPHTSYLFALVVVRKGDRFLLVHERKHGQLWYLPGGGVDPGESFAQAAIRETREEAGIDIELDGVVRFEHSPSSGSDRMRVIFLAHPIDDRAPKSTPDDESLGAKWVSLDEIASHPLRGRDAEEYFRWVAGGAAIVPMSALAREDDPVT